MTKRIIALVASLAVVIGLMNCGTSYAWFVTTLEKKQSISVSVVSTSQTAKLTDIDGDTKTIIMPGDNLVSLDGQGAMLRVNNGSTTNVQIRLSIEYTKYSSGKAEQRIYSGSNDDIDVTFAAGKWSKNVNASGVCYFYYMGDNYETAEISSLDKVPSIYKESITRAYSGQPVNIKVKFEAKQADNVSWDTIDAYQLSGTNA